MSVLQRVYSAELVQFLNVYLQSSRQRITQLENRRDALEVKASVYTDLKSKLSTLRSIAEEMAGTDALSVFGAKTTTTSNSDVLTATAGAGAVAMTHIIHVEQLARAHSVISNRYASSDADLSDSYAGTKAFTITVDGNDYNVSVTIESGDTNEDAITKIASAINDVTDIPVRATKIDDTASTSKLYIASSETGTENKMTFTDTDGLLAALGVTNDSEATDTVGGYIYADLEGNELDAILTLDGISIIRSSNTVSDILTGVTLELHTEQEVGEEVTLNVSVDTETIKSKVEEFLDAYNEAFQYLVSKVSVDSTTYVRGDLAGDFPYINLWHNMRTTLAGSVSSVEGGTYSSLSQIGITSSTAGTFSISDADDFEEALANHLDAVEDLFNSADGVAVQLEDLLDDYTAASGIIWTSKDGVNSQIELLGDRIDRLEIVQSMREEQLVKQYGALQEASYLQQVVLQILNGMSSWLAG